MTLLPAIVAASVLLVPLASQVVSTSLTALTPISCEAGFGTANQSQILEPGPLPQVGNCIALQSNAGSLQSSATFFWSGEQGIAEAGASLALGLGVGDPAGSAQFDEAELLVEVSASSSVRVRYEIEADISVFGVSPLPAAVDIGNDGTIDWFAGLTQNHIGYVADLARQPLRFRVIVSGAVEGAGHASVDLRIRVTADTGILAVQNVAGCRLGGSYRALPLFDTSRADLALIADGPSELVVHVIGFTPEPELLPFPIMPVPCLLVPAPDVLLLGKVALVPMPAAVRPATIFAQGVVVGFALTTMDGYTVSAF